MTKEEMALRKEQAEQDNREAFFNDLAELSRQRNHVYTTKGKQIYVRNNSLRITATPLYLRQARIEHYHSSVRGVFAHTCKTSYR
jgi:hypothetical protein